MFILTVAFSVISLFFSFFFNFIYFSLCWVFIAPHGLAQVEASWGYSLVTGRGLLTEVAAVVMARRL